ncbi:hypothetical protein ACJ41O_008820 [Fusarium nematophilum]
MSEYQLPDWFLANNVILPADLDKIRLNIEVAPENASEDDEDTPDGSLMYQVFGDKFSEIRDTIAAALTRNSQGILDPSQLSAVIETSLSQPDFLDSLIKLVAKDVKVSLISFGLEDLQDLGQAFHLQDLADSSSPGSSGDSIETEKLGQHYFASPSEAHATEDVWQRCRKALSTVFSAIPRTPDPCSIIVHLREAPAMMAAKNGYRFIARLRNFLEQLRKDGQSIVLVATIPYDRWDANWDKFLLEIGVKDFARLKAYPSNTESLPDDSPSNAALNIRRLKRGLRGRIPDMFAPEVLRPNTDWSQKIDCQSDACLGKCLWSSEYIQRAVVQITGRSWGRSQLDMGDVIQVLSRVGLHCHDQPVEEEPEYQVECPSTPEVLPEREPTWEDKIANIRYGCNSRESALLDSVVDPAKIQSSYDDVIIDQDLKETVLHLVSSSYLLPSTSSRLLRQARIKGILLYGPPGTGKTHLARSIAKESGAAMLSVDCATLVSKWVGQTESNIKAAFSLASKLFPCVLFIDEVDSLFYSRETATRTWERSAVTQFLSEMDGLVEDDRAPCVIVATNRPRALDKAFLRRLPQKIPVGLPDLEARTKILGLFLRSEDIDPLVSVESLARQTEGYSGSDLRSVCAEAALIWAIQQSKGLRGKDSQDEMRLGLVHFAKALLRIRPSVSKGDLVELERFAQRFNPDSVEDGS